MARELVLWLLQQGHQPIHLRPQSADGLMDALQEAIHLRERGQAELSLTFLQQMQSQGFNSPWIADNAARALVEQGRTQQAVEIWEALLNDQDRAVAEHASSTLAAVVAPLIQALHACCSRHGWTPRHLPSPQAAVTQNTLLAVLEEAIACRESQRAGLSLELLEITLQHGWQSPWLLDNKARALVNLSRHSEACTVWEELQHNSDSTAAAEAKRMLGDYQPHRIQHPIEQRLQALRQAGQEDEAKQLLLSTLIHNLDDPLLWSLLEQQQGASSDGLLQMELEPVHRQLGAHEIVLSHLESSLNQL